MTPTLTSLLSSITPEMFISDFALKGTVNEVNDHIYCGIDGVGYCFSYAGGLLSDNPGLNTFRAGSIVDAMAVSVLSRGKKIGEAAFIEAVRIIVSKYRDVLLPVWQDAETLESVGRQAYYKRRMFNKIVCASGGVQNLPCGILAIAGKEIGQLLKCAPGSSAALLKEDVKDLEGRVNQAGFDVSLPESACVILPYFSNAHTIAGIDVYYRLAGGRRMSKFITLEDSKVSYFNLLSYKPGYNYFVTALPGRAAEAFEEMRKRRDTSTCMCLHTGESQCVEFIPSAVTYVPEDGIESLYEPGLLHLIGCDVTVSSYIGSNSSIQEKYATPWHSYVIDKALEEFGKSKELTSRARLILSSVKMDSYVRGAIRSRVLQMGYAALSRQLDSVFHEGLIFENNAFRIFSTEEGYKYEDKKNPDIGMDALTNFTIKLDAMVVYSDEQHLYRGIIQMKGRKGIPVLLQLGDLDTMKKLDAAVKQAVGSAGANSMPSVFDLTASRPIIPYLRKMTSTLPIVTGVSQLGWNGVKTKYSTPYSVNDGNPSYPDVMLHPASPALQYYSSSVDVIAKKQYCGIPESLLNIIKVCAAYIARSYVGYSVRPVFFINDANSRKVFQRMFSATGQQTAMELNKNVRSKAGVSGIYGYPHFAYGTYSPQLKSVESPVFVLGDIGKAFAEPITDDQLKRAARLLYDTIHKVPSYLIQTKGETYNRKCSVQYETSLIREGESILQDVIPFVKTLPPYENEYDCLESVLGTLTIEQASDTFSMDGESILIPSTLLDRPDRDMIISQMRCLVSRVECGDAVVKIDQVTGYSMLASYYGMDFKLKPDQKLTDQFIQLTSR